MNNVCMTGLARNGKDTVGKMFRDMLPDYTMYALAQPIKDVMCALFSWGKEHRDGSYKEIKLKYAITPDSIQQAGGMYNKYGLDKYEAFHDCWEKLINLFDVQLQEGGLAYCYISPREAFQKFGTEWGRTVHPTIWLEVAPTSNTIITDVRFDNEAEYFKSHGAIVVEVVRPGFGNVAAKHVSEAGISRSLITETILNDGTLEQLHEASIQFMRLYRWTLNHNW